MVAGQDHDRQPGLRERSAGAVGRRRGDHVIVESIAGEQHDIGAELAGDRQYRAQPGGAVAVMLRGDALVVDMQVRRMNEKDVAHQLRSKSMRSVTGRP